MAKHKHVNQEAKKEQSQDPEEVIEVSAEVIETPAEEEVEALKDEVVQAKAKADEYLDGWQRALADFSNYRKRIERDQAQLHANTVGNIVRRYLDVLDDLERALKNRPQNSEGAGWAEGIELIYRKLFSALEAEGINRMNVEGQFDPNLHEAISQEDSPDHESGEIIEVVSPGYTIKDRIIRPARVRVAR